MGVESMTPGQMKLVLGGRGVHCKFARMTVAEWLANPRRRTQAEEARRIGITPRHFRRLVRLLRQDIYKHVPSYAEDISARELQP